jgi:hypothetical protein
MIRALLESVGFLAVVVLVAASLAISLSRQADGFNSRFGLFLALACDLIMVWVLLSTRPAWADALSPMPDPALTPGVVRQLTLAEVCTTKWGKDERAVTDAMKAQVYQAYKIDIHRVAGKWLFPKFADGSSAYEVDHLISREIGGADDVKNLWPQPYTGPWNAHLKDKVENRLHVEVCAGHLSLEDAQTQIKTDWRVPYRIYFGEPPVR